MSERKEIWKDTMNIEKEIEMVTTEVRLDHGEVIVDIMCGPKSVIFDGQSITGFSQTLFVKMIDCFDEITLVLTAKMGDEFGHWEIDSLYGLKEKGNCETYEEAIDMCDTVIDNGLIYSLGQQYSYNWYNSGCSYCT